MAVYNLTASAGSRASGASAAAKCDYLEREGRYRRDAADLRDSEHGNMPEWAEDDPHSYWQAADQFERANGRLYREVHFALPVELDRDQQLALARRFAEDLTGAEKLPYTLAIHEGAKPGRESNPHAHLMWSERGNDGIARSAETWFKRYNAKAPERGGARKSKAGDARDWIPSIRERWAGRCNEALARAGHRERVDHRSLAARAVEAFEAGDEERGMALSREPNVHLGPAAVMSIERVVQGEAPPRALEAAREVVWRNDDRAVAWSALERELRGLRRELAALRTEVRELTRRIPEVARRAVEWAQARRWRGPEIDHGPSR